MRRPPEKPRIRSRAAWALILLGLLAIGLALGADLRSSAAPGFGARQARLLVLGLLLSGTGILLRSARLSSTRIARPRRRLAPGLLGLRVWGGLLVGTAILANPWLVHWLYDFSPTSRVEWLMVETATGILGIVLLLSARRAVRSVQGSSLRHLLTLSNVALTVLLTCVAIEGVVRTYAAMQLGISRGLFYGTELAVIYRSPSQDKKHGYVTFKPHQKGVFVRSLVHPARKIQVRINNLGFRGQDVLRSKPESTLRIVTLGASSTFGFRDADDETYPHYLEQMLQERFGGSRRIEVLNLGIPHLMSDEIANLFEAEALPLDPDIVTFYEGVNDTKLGHVLPFGKIGAYLLTARFIETLFVEMTRTTESNDADLQRWVAGRSEFFLGNLERILAACKARRIPFFVISQQAQSKTLEQLRGVTYEDEWRRVHGFFEDGKDVGYRGRLFLIHHKIMADLRDWVRKRNVPFIDGIAALDARRDTLTSWVHLSPEGNRILARAIAERLEAALRRFRAMESLTRSGRSLSSSAPSLGDP